MIKEKKATPWTASDAKACDQKRIWEMWKEWKKISF